MRVAILLAAGASRRWGAGNKLVARVGGAALAVRSLRVARAAPAGRVIVVVGAQGARVAAAVRAAPAPGVTVVRARGHREGIAASLRAGLAAMRPAERVAIVFLGDMPAVPPLLAGRLVRALRVGDRAVRPAYRGVPGHPVVVQRPSREVIAGLRGDRGLGPLLRDARLVPGPRGAVVDLDRRADSRGRALSGLIR